MKQGEGNEYHIRIGDRAMVFPALRAIEDEDLEGGGKLADFRSGKAPLFLISLKAGGTGLNLTAADTVIHYDPWWNPAAEAQATDRAYRIGQKNPVFVHKLLCQETVEERIHQLQQNKAKLANNLLSEADVAQKLDASMVRALLE